MKINHKVTAQTKYYKLFLPVLYLIVGITFFSCQNKEVKNTEVPRDTLTTKSGVSEKSTISTKKTDQPPPDSPKVEQLKLEKPIPIVNKEVSETKTSKADKAKKENSSVVVKAPSNLNAEFPGGIDQFHSFFMKEYKKPESVNYWKLNFTLAFAVEKNGSVSFLECSPAVEEPLEKEIIRVLSLCPKWQPGESNGKKIRMQYSVPILLK
ncbi:hypothetical protein [Flavobacterium branchiicola]|uniref:TonB C-terminal domain-containing protein n=1 Tax=Flavobacterium branchiicola TaxID=1114875 RepID=A0ABV9P982_9FLAO|nr:hypothetical protein [Flavobacterium branchiicola]MBS7252803.1 hypothetical protein [Flavobacterium branchiicola]